VLSLVAAAVLTAFSPQITVTPPRQPLDPGQARPQGGNYGEPEGVTLEGLNLAPESCEGDHVIAKGRLDLLEQGTYWLLVDGNARALLLGAYGSDGREFDRRIGTWVEVRGICRPIKRKEYVYDKDVDTIKFPDLPPLPAPGGNRPNVSITVLSLTDAVGPGREGSGAETAIIATVLNDPGAFVGVDVRVVGLFRGRNLFDDLPAASQRSHSDWVLKEGETALWITGKAPKGKGWSLDPGYKGDTARWLAVEGKIEVANGVAYMRASKVILTRDPRLQSDEQR
jgi:hypothetical protein